MGDLPKPCVKALDFMSKGKSMLLPLRVEKLQGRGFSDLP